ncbi:ankyrin repeat domain-containing protein [Carpediemonas membranifera]|uniref:Ankyrin repeat domain-containing protein n=1 Tax=Carpediemonas membranifera TaxID=201153 RepID=A0A8J6E2N8_9EUKA|nr:ankyrin repeat domain-containing protein [Carpediemonas membranifera]|eukprot:KAG9394556.1 ankyrin repeat domain-containing protein [Carpediemonas membranifera]
MPQAYRLHRLVWKRNLVGIANHLVHYPESIDEKDLHGNTPLHLAVKLAYPEVVSFLCVKGANTRIPNSYGWTPAHEAFSQPYDEIAQALVPFHTMQKSPTQHNDIAGIFNIIERLPDFELKLQWKFETLLQPLSNVFLPHDEYRITKKGTRVRIDSSLIGFRYLIPLRGKMTHIMSRAADGTPQLTIVDHDQRVYLKSRLTEAGEWVEAEEDDNDSSEDNFFDLEAQTPVQNMSQQPKEEVTFVTIARDARKKVARGAIQLELDASELEFKELGSQHYSGWRARLFVRPIPQLALGLSENPSAFMGTGMKLRLRLKGGRFFGGNKERIPNPSPPLNLHSPWTVAGVEAGLVREMRSARPSATWYETTDLKTAVEFISYTEYFHTRPGKGARQRFGDIEGSALLPVFNEREFVRAVPMDLWMVSSAAVPFTVADMIALIKAFEPSSPPLKKLREVLEMSLPEGFPVHIRVPVFVGMSALMTISHIKERSDISDELFSVPAGYDRAGEGELDEVGKFEFGVAE